MAPSRFAVLFCAVLLAAACTAPASRTAPDAGSDGSAAGDAENAPAVAAAAEEDPLVCETVVRTGTRVAQRTCMRQSEIDRRRRNAQDALGNAQRGGVQAGNETRE